MYEYTVIEVYQDELEIKINNMAKIGWELHSSIISDFKYDRTEEYCHNIKVESYKLVFKRQK